MLEKNLDSIVMVILFHHIFPVCLSLEKLTYFISIPHFKSLLINKFFNINAFNFHFLELFLSDIFDYLQGIFKNILISNKNGTSGGGEEEVINVLAR